MCTCHSEISKKLLDHFTAKTPEGSREFEIQIEGFLFGITEEGGVTHRSSNNVKVSYLAPKKGGGEKKVNTKTFLRATFCPFCGVKYE